MAAGAVVVGHMDDRCVGLACLRAVGRHLELVHHDVHVERTRLSQQAWGHAVEAAAGAG